MSAKIAVILDITEDYPALVQEELEAYWRQRDDKGQSSFQHFYMDDF